MSHVDDGTLHAYLDGELSPVERERLDGHLAGCVACRARLDEERALIERAGRLLGLAAPPEHVAPPLHALRNRPGRGSGFLIPLAWAAVVTIAIGVGWYARGAFVTHRTQSESDEARLAPGTPATLPRATGANESTQDQLAAAPLPSPAPAGRAEPRRDRPAQPAPVQDGAVASQGVAEREESGQRLRAPPATPAAAKALQATGNVVAVTASGAKDDSIRRAAAAWPTVESKQARDVLGEEPGVIPGYPLTALRSNPTDPAEIVVEQRVGSGVVSLFERRSEVAAGGARRPAPAQRQGFASNERLARYVRSLRIEIAGTLPADSLSRLLNLIQ